MAQEHEDITPNYKLSEEHGPDHSKEFIMAAYIGERKIAEGRGSSKQNAEQDAAVKALQALGWDK